MNIEANDFNLEATLDSGQVFGFLKRIILAIEWLLVPLIIVFLSALPALDAQTRLMFGRYMEFWVTDKKRRSQTAI